MLKSLTDDVEWNFHLTYVGIDVFPTFSSSNEMRNLA